MKYHFHMQEKDVRCALKTNKHIIKS